MLRYTLTLALLLPVFDGLATQAAAQHACDDPEADQWVKDVHGWTSSYDALAMYAVEVYGQPVQCVGQVTSEFDGVDYGLIHLDFAGGAVFEMETQPPETSIATLTDSSGFRDEVAVRDLLEKYAADIGVKIDWTTASVEEVEKERTVRFWDPEEGLNASATFVYREQRLVTARFSMAL